MSLYKTDQLWIQGVIRREREALTILYDRYGSLCWSLFLRITRDPKAAEHLLEDLFLRIPIYARKYPESFMPFKTWIFAVARDMGIDFIRCRRLNRVVFQERTASVMDDRQILELAYLDGWSLHEIARALNTSLEAATNLLRAAFRNRKATLTEQAH